jgi:transcriptional regulator with XRE-family HTH domain
MAIGDFVKEQRKKVGLNQTELAERIGTSKQVINLIEFGVTRVPSEKIMDGLSEVFDVPKSDIIAYVYPSE